MGLVFVKVNQNSIFVPSTHIIVCQRFLNLYNCRKTVLAGFDEKGRCRSMINRFVFRQTYFQDLQIFLNDGEIRAKNHTMPQLCHQTSYQDIVDRRGTDQFSMPCGGVVNDYVPFYFSPFTAFTYTIHQGNVDLRGPDGAVLGKASSDSRVFLVANVNKFADSGLRLCFTDYPLNSLSPMPNLESDLSKIETHVHWDTFDDEPVTCKIQEIGYNGVCRYFADRATPARDQNRKRKRMAEFLVKMAVPLGLLDCIIVKNDETLAAVCEMLTKSNCEIPVYKKPGCFF